MYRIMTLDTSELSNLFEALSEKKIDPILKADLAYLLASKNKKELLPTIDSVVTKLDHANLLFNYETKNA